MDELFKSFGLKKSIKLVGVDFEENEIYDEFHFENGMTLFSRVYEKENKDVLKRYGFIN